MIEQEQPGANRAQYGKEIVRELAARSTREFGNGFSKTNLESLLPGYKLNSSDSLTNSYLSRFDDTLKTCAHLPDAMRVLIWAGA
jgi:hypothetical protein